MASGTKVSASCLRRASHQPAESDTAIVGRIAIVGLGPAGPELITPDTLARIETSQRCFLRTRVHPAATGLSGVESFDDLYESSATFAEVYRSIADSLVAEARQSDVVYAVPGSPLVLERSVAILRDEANKTGIEVEVLPAMSFLDVAWARLAIDPVEESVRLIDGHVFATAAAGQTGPLLVAHCHARHVLSDIKLTLDDGPGRVVVLQRLGSPDELITEVAWNDLDREVDADHLTSIYIPSLASPVASEFVRFDELVRVLRSDCPWDNEQTHASLRPHLLEETHETIEALDARAEIADDVVDDAADAHLSEELGDLLYQIFFHARLGAERGSFTITDVVSGIHDKLVSRHPHVFEDVVADDSEAVLTNWEKIKRDEKGRESAMDGVPPSLPALMLAHKFQKRASSAGLGPSSELAEARAEIAGRVDALEDDQTDESIGDLLFAVVDIARRVGVDPESALRAAAGRFEDTCRETESNIARG